MIIDNRQYVFTILKIILYTNIPAIIMLPVHLSTSLGWILGSLGSAINFWFMAKSTLSIDTNLGRTNTIHTTKKALFRFLFLIVWSVVVLMVIKPELITYCIGLLSAQIAIVLYQIYISIRYGKLKDYF